MKIKVSDLITQKATLKYIPVENLDAFEVGSIVDGAEYFLILNTKEIFNTINDTNIYAVMRDNMFQGISFWNGFCGWDCYLYMTDENYSFGTSSV